MAGLAMAAATLYAANQTREANKDAIGSMEGLGNQLAYSPLPGYARRAKKGMQSILDPAVAAWVAGDRPTVISPDLENKQYASLLSMLKEPYQEGRDSLEQTMRNRGLGYGNVIPKAVGKYDQRYERTLGDLGTQIATDAAKTNYAAGQNERASLMDWLGNMFSQGKQTQDQRQGMGYQMLGGVPSAEAANEGSFWNSAASAIGSAFGGMSGMNLGGLAGGGLSNLFAKSASALAGSPVASRRNLASFAG